MLYDDGARRDFVYLDVNPAFAEITGLHEWSAGGERRDPRHPREQPRAVRRLRARRSHGEAEPSSRTSRPAQLARGRGLQSAPDHFVAVFEKSPSASAPTGARELVEFLRLLNEGRGMRDLVERVRLVRAGATAAARRWATPARRRRLSLLRDPRLSARFVEIERSLCGRDEPAIPCSTRPATPCSTACAATSCEAASTRPSRSSAAAARSGATAPAKLLAATTDEDRLTHTRNRCNGDGYESVLLVPLRVGEEPLGSCS